MEWEHGKSIDKMDCETGPPVRELQPERYWSEPHTCWVPIPLTFQCATWLIPEADT